MCHTDPFRSYLAGIDAVRSALARTAQCQPVRTRLPLVPAPARTGPGAPPGQVPDPRSRAQPSHSLPVMPAAPWVVNLCQDRGLFLLALCAALVRGVRCLLPPSPAARAVEELAYAHPGALCLCDEPLEAGGANAPAVADRGAHRPARRRPVPMPAIARAWEIISSPPGAPDAPGPPEALGQPLDRRPRGWATLGCRCRRQ